MAELTIDQQKALALAAARKRATEAGGAVAAAPVGIKPGSKEYAIWARDQALAGNELPQVSPTPPEASQPTDPLLAASGSFIEGFPVVGGPAVGLLKDGRAAVQGMTREEVDREYEAAKKANPVASTAANIGGAVLSTAPLAATRVGQAAFGMTGPLLQRLALGGASGAALGGADALVDSGGDAAAGLEGAAVGGGLGAAGGAAGPYIDDALGAAGRLLGLRSNIAADTLPRPARDVLTRAFGGDDALGGAGEAAIRASGPGGMLVDASPSALGVLDTAIARGGPGASGARNAIETRAANANTTVNQALDQALGVPQGVTATETGIRRGSAASRDAAYKAAYAQPIDYSSEAGFALDDMIKRVPQGVVQLANRMMQLEGHQSKQILAQIADDGTVTFLRKPDVLQIDYITRALNTAAKSGEGQGALGGMTDIGRSYANLARELRDVTRTAVPEYDTALSTAATPIQAREGLRFGEGLLNPSLTRDEASETIAALTGPQVEAARQGLRSHIDDVLANVTRVVSDPNLDAREARKALQDLSTRAAREKIAMILPTAADANRLFAQLAQATRALELRAGVATNSRTAGRVMTDEAVNEAIRGGPLNSLLRGEPVNAARTAVQGVTGRTPAGERNISDRVYAQLANALTLQGDDAIDMLSGLAFRSNNPRLTGIYAPGLAQFLGEQVPPITARP